MAIAHRATASATAANTSDDGVTVSKPTGTVDGDVMLAWITTSAQKAVTAPAGWTLLNFNWNAGDFSYLYYRVASSEGASYAWTWTDSKGTGIISSYSGASTTDPIWSTAWFASPSNTSSHTVPNPFGLGTTPSNAMIVAFLALGRGQTTTTEPAGFTLPANGNPDTGGTGTDSTESAVAYKSYSGGGWPGGSWTTSNGGYDSLATVILRESGDTTAVLRVISTETTLNSGASSQALAMPYGYTTNDLLVAVCSWRGTATVSSFTGWTQKGSTVQSTNGTNSNIAVFYKYATSASESGTLVLSASNSMTCSVVAIRRTGISGDPFLDYQTAQDTSSNATSDFPALTVSAQDMLAFGSVARRHDHVGTASPAGYYGLAGQYTQDDTYGPNPWWSRLTNLGSSYTILGLVGKFTSSANPAGGTFTHSNSSESAGVAFAIGKGVLAPVAAFSADATTVKKNATVTFTDASTGTPTSWLWDFGDGHTSTSQSPTHAYDTAGTYTVVLTATNAGGSDGETKTGYITVTAGRSRGRLVAAAWGRRHRR